MTTPFEDFIEFVQSLALIFCGCAIMVMTTSCGSLANARYEPSRWDRATNSQVREDTANLNAGRPLRHFSSEKRLKAERQDRFIDRIMYD